MFRKIIRKKIIFSFLPFFKFEENPYDKTNANDEKIKSFSNLTGTERLKKLFEIE
jgi:hypothetical protein